MKYQVNTRQTDLNVRSGPGLAYPVVGSLAKGTLVEVKTMRSGWAALAGGGWASSEYLKLAAGGPTTSVATRKIVVDLRTQKLEAYLGDTIVFSFPCVTGDRAHPTEPGRFKIMRKVHPYTSRTYKVPMDYAMFFTRDGKAIHQYHGPVALGLLRSFRLGPLGATVGSHGCVRLSEVDARMMYAWTPVGTEVIVQ
jgi:hypothetical protein